jgi:ankyrin repeat protein
LHFAAQKNHAEVCRLLLEKGADVNAMNANRMTPLLCTIARGNEKACQALLLGNKPRVHGNKADIGARSPHHGIISLSWAAKLGHAEICALLIDLGGAYVNYVDAMGMTALHYAAQEGHSAVCALLVDKGANLLKLTSEEGLSPQHLATHYQQTAAIAILTQKFEDAYNG